MSDRASVRLVKDQQAIRRLWDEKGKQRDAAMQAVKDIKTAMGHIEDQNFGLAKEWIENALDHLPFDNGEYIVWPAVER